MFIKLMYNLTQSFKVLFSFASQPILTFVETLCRWSTVLYMAFLELAFTGFVLIYSITNVTYASGPSLLLLVFYALRMDS